jgi:hypothetical protein
LGQKLVGVWDCVDLSVFLKKSSEDFTLEGLASLLLSELLGHRNFEIASCS